MSIRWDINSRSIPADGLSESDHCSRLSKAVLSEDSIEALHASNIAFYLKFKICVMV